MVSFIRKRDGRLVKYDSSKVSSAILKAAQAVYGEDGSDEYYTLSVKYAKEVRWHVNNDFGNSDREPSVEDIQDIIEKILIYHKEEKVAKEYVLYRNKRTQAREMNSRLMSDIRDIISKPSSEVDLKRENANIDSETSMGAMLKIGSEVSKQVYKGYYMRPEIASAHDDGDIHIHDADFAMIGTTTCTQIDIKDLLSRGFNTGHGFIRSPSNIITAAALACIAIQSNQNDQHGGQSIPNFDYGMAPYVVKTFYKKIKEVFNIKYDNISNYDIENVIKYLDNQYRDTNTVISIRLSENIDQLIIGFRNSTLNKILDKAYELTVKDTHQAMQALVHNLNSMHSRAGAQVPFSSLNYGTDTSDEGRIVIRELLLATEEGLGNGETPIFPIQIFKVKEGVNYNKEDPNYDLFKLACKVSAKRLFPNFSFIDASYNIPYYKEGHPETEAAYMGCRTRVVANVYDKTREVVTSRGNLSFTSINLPRLAIRYANEETNRDFIELLDEKIDLIFQQLLDRLEVQKHKKVKNFPFLMGQGLWMDSSNLNYNDELGDILNHGTLSVGFIGLAECLKMLTGKHHGESKESQELGLEIVRHIRMRCDEKSSETGLNFTCLATPAEGLSGRFIRLDKKKYGIIPGVTDRDYYTNSFHVPVYYNISIYDKLRIEGEYHKLCNAGHISYIEMDGDPSKNLDAFESVVRLAHDCDIGYFAINHPIDQCTVCGYNGIIDDVCPRCGRHDGEEIDLDKLIELKKIYPEIQIPNE